MLEKIPMRYSVGRVPIYWQSKEWKPTTKYKIPHKCEVGKHWFWGRGVYQVEHFVYDTDMHYRCETCHAAKLLEGESNEPRYTSGVGSMQLNASFLRLLDEAAGTGFNSGQDASGAGSAYGSGVADHWADCE